MRFTKTTGTDNRTSTADTITIITAEDVANSTDYIKPYTTSTGYIIDTMTKLEYEVAACTDNFDSEGINELKPIVLELAKIVDTVPNSYKVDIMLDWIKEAEESIEVYTEYESEKAALIPELVQYYKNNPNTAPIAQELAEEQAEEMTWDLAYRN